MDSYWDRERAEFLDHRDSHLGSDYRDWQPAKWQSLSRVRDVLRTDFLPGPGRSALELGCGSATLLIQLAMDGVDTTGVDRDGAALDLARLSAESLGATPPSLVKAEVEDAAAELAVSDLVLHIGVIEHFERAEQLEFLRLSARLARRWVLVGIPNTTSPLFRSFLTTMQQRDAVYEDEHLPIDVPDLADELGFGVAWADGAHVLLGRADLYHPGDPSLDAFYARLGARLRAHGERYDAFPALDFTASDVEPMRAVESACSTGERMEFGFLRLYLLDVS